MTHTKEAQAEAINELRKSIHPGDTLYCILRHVSRSGMMRVIDILKMSTNGHRDRIFPRYLSYHIERALDLRADKNHSQGIRVEGCGMDMGFHLVYSLGCLLWPKGRKITKRLAQSGAPVRGEIGQVEPDGGYLIKHEWL